MDTNEKTTGIMTDRVLDLTCSECKCQIDVSDLAPFVKVKCPDCGHVDVVPAKLGPFLLLNLIDAGGMGGIYYARDETLGRDVAIKVMLKSLGDNQEFVETFKREAQAAAKLNHPNIAQIYSFGQEKGQPYIVMELISGQRFDKMIASGEPLDQALVMRIAMDVVEGLTAADEAGLLHGDIKPENILLDEKGAAKLVDFGLAAIAAQAAEAEGVWGTPYYIAPEKLKRQKADVRSDIYSLGATLYHALGGRPPFEGETPVEVVKARLERAPEELHLIRPDIHKKVEALVSRMLEADPVRRYPTYASLAGDLRAIIQELGTPSSVGAKPGRKTVILKKKRAAAPDTGPSRGGIEEVVPPQKSTKLVVRKKEKMKISSPMPEDKGVPSELESKSEPESEEERRKIMEEARKKRERRKKQRRKIIKVVLWTCLTAFVILSGIGAAVYVKRKKEKRIQARKEAFALAEERQNATARFDELSKATANVIAMEHTARRFLDGATNAVYVVLGKHFELPPEPAEETPAKSPDKKPDAAATPTNGTAGAQVSTNAPAGADSPATNASATTGVSQATNAPPAAEPAKPEAPPEKKVERPPEHEIEVLAGEVLSCARKITKKAEAARKIESDAFEMKKLILMTRSLSQAAANAKKLSESLASAQALGKEAEAVLRKAEGVLQRVEMMRNRKEREAETRKKADEEAARKRAEEEARRRKEEEQKVLVESEMNAVDTARGKCQPLIKEYKYNEAIDSLNAQFMYFSSDKGKEAAKNLIERYSRLHKLKLFVMEQLNAEPFLWGWTQGRQAEDVLGADENNVKLRGGTVPWTSVTTAQMLKFIRHFLENRKFPIKTLGEHNLAAAIFCYENGGKDAAARFAEKTVDLCPYLQDDVKRLLPFDE